MKFSDERRESTKLRHNEVHAAYAKVVSELGTYAMLVPKSYIYDKIREKTGLCDKTIAYVINHTIRTPQK